MKKHVRKLFALALCLMIVGSVALSSSAEQMDPIGATEYFTINGKEYTANIQCDDIAYTEKFFNLSQAEQHTFGTRTWLSFHGAYDETATYEYTTSGSDLYFSYIESAGAQLGILTSVTASESAVRLYTYEVRANEPSGVYAMGIRFVGYSGQWMVAEGMIMTSLDGAVPAAIVPPSGSGSGIISFAPTGAYELGAFLVS